MLDRFWVLGPVETSPNKFQYGVVDVFDTSGRIEHRKPSCYQEFWDSEEEANKHRDYLNEKYRESN